MVMTGPADPFAALAPFYDLDLDEYTEDVALYLELAEQAGGEILELGCGTGRVAVALAADGQRVTGVDLSPAMLEIARQQAEAHGVTGRLTLTQGDLRTLQLHRPFPLVLVPLGGLEHMETADDLAAALAAIARHLAPGGVAAVDVAMPDGDDFTPGYRPLIEHWTRPLPAVLGPGQVTKLVAIESRPAAGQRDVTYHFDIQPAEGGLRRVTQQFTLRLVTPGELELAARLAGLAVTGWYGDYAWSPLDEGSERVVALLEHAS